MQAAVVVDLIDEVGKVCGDILEGLVGHWIDGLDLERLHKALGLGVVKWIAAAAHRPDEAVLGEGLPIETGRVFGGLTDRRNILVLRIAKELVERLSRSFPAKGLARPGVDHMSDGVELIARMPAEIGAFWEVLS